DLQIGVDAFCFFFSSRRRHTRFKCDWSSDVCSSDLWSKARLYEELYQLLAGDFAQPVEFLVEPRLRPAGVAEGALMLGADDEDRSEERRVGKGGRGGCGREWDG